MQDGLLALGAVPTGKEGIQTAVVLAQFAAREVAQALGDQLAFAVQVFHPFGHDAHGHIVHVHLAALGAAARW